MKLQDLRDNVNRLREQISISGGLDCSECALWTQRQLGMGQCVTLLGFTRNKGALINEEFSIYEPFGQSEQYRYHCFLIVKLNNRSYRVDLTAAKMVESLGVSLNALYAINPKIETFRLYYGADNGRVSAGSIYHATIEQLNKLGFKLYKEFRRQ